jgi:hypothetical protein
MGRVEGIGTPFTGRRSAPQARGLPRLPPAAHLAHGRWRAIRNVLAVLWPAQAGLRGPPTCAGIRPGR